MNTHIRIRRCVGILFLSLSFSPAVASEGLEVTFGQNAPPKLDEIVFADLPSVNIPQANEPVTLGQPFSEGAWKQALKLEGFSRTEQYAMQIARGLAGGDEAASFLKEATQPRQKTTAFLLFDEQNLYVGFQCWDDDMKNLVVEPTRKRDGAVWGADSVEVFLAPWQSSAEYFQFVVDSRGTIYDAVNRFFQDEGGQRKVIDKTWNAGLEVFAKCHDDCWIVQMKIPFKDLGLSSKDRARINLGRSETMGTKVEHSSWIQVEEGFHETERFGEVCFGRAPLTPPVKVEKIAFPDPMWGENGMKVWLKGTGKAIPQATIRAELLDAKGKPEDTVSRCISLPKGKGACVVYLPYRISQFGKHTILLSLLNPIGKAVYEQRTLPLSTPDMLDVQCPDSFFSTSPTGTAVTTLNVSPASLEEVQLRYFVLTDDSKDQPVARKDVSDVRSRVIYTQIKLAAIPLDVTCRFRVEVIQKATGKILGVQNIPFRRVNLNW